MQHVASGNQTCVQTQAAREDTAPNMLPDTDRQQIPKQVPKVQLITVGLMVANLMNLFLKVAFP